MLSSNFLSDHSLSLKEGEAESAPPPNGSHPVKQPNVTRVKIMQMKNYYEHMLEFIGIRKESLLYRNIS